MRRSGSLLLALAVLMLAVRLFTGIYYTSDSALAYFVLKPAPDWTIERYRVDEPRFDRATVLDDDELDLAYGGLYRGAMTGVPVAVALLAALAFTWGRRRR